MTNTSTNSDTPPTIRFRLTDNDLIVENFGENAKAFTRKGVISICHTCISEKSNHSKDCYECKDYDIPGKIREKMIDKWDDNDRQSHIIKEEQAADDYSGRFALELLQNADDAVGKKPDEMIGMKGLGFKSVFKIADEPEIRSGDFHFRFEKQHDDLRLPECIEAVECAVATQIRLPFRNDAAKKAAQTARDELNSMRADILLFCQSLRRIDIERDGLPARRLEIRIVSRDDENLDQIRVDDIELIEKSGEEIISATSWRRWLCKPQPASGGKRISAGVCLPLDNEGKISSREKDESLRVFFPTEEQIEGARALIHASCAVDSNRKHLSDAEGPDCDSICKMLRNLVKEILSSQKEDSAGALLQAFGKIKTAENPDDKKMVNRLGNAIAEAVRETAFVPVIGGDFVKPAEVCLWEFGIGKVLRPEKVRDQKLLAPNLEKEIRILAGLEASEINDEKHAYILRHCKNDLLEECLEAAKTAAKIAAKYAHAGVTKTIESLREAPFWWTGKIGRPLNGEPHLLRKRPVEWPNLIKFEALDSDFSNELTPPATNADKTQAPENGDFNSLKICRIWPLEPSDYFDRVLLPFCQGKSVEWWQDNGGEILSWVLKWNGKLKMLAQAQRNVYFPTDKGWLVANDCYAGEAWGGPAHFDSFFKDIPNRGVVLPLKDWGMSPDAGNSVEKWKPLLERFGVSRTPKTWQCSQEKLRHIDRKYGLESDAIERLISERRPYGSSDVLFVDHFPKSMGKKPSEILEMAMDMKRNRFKFSRFSQFQTCRWLPCTQAILSREGERLARPKDVYMPGCDLDGLLPAVDTDGISDDKLRTSGIKDLLIELGVRQNIQDEPAEKIREWMVELQKRENNAQLDASFRWGESGRVAKQHGKYAEVAKAVYAHYLKNFGAIPKDSPVPYLRETDKGVFIAFALARDVFWLDQPYLGEPGIRKAVVKAGFKIFVFTLKDENADKSGLDPISKKLSMECIYGGDSLEETRLLCEKYAERWRILQLIIPENAKGKLSGDIKICAHKGLWMESQEFPEIKPETDFHLMEDGKLFVNVDGDKLRKWSALAAGLSTIVGNRAYAPDLESLLMHGEDECMRRLRNQYHLTEAAIRESEVFAGNLSDSPQENAEEAETPTPDFGSPAAVENIEAPARDATMPRKENRILPGETGESPAASGQSSAYPPVSGERISRPANSGGTSGGGDPEIKKEVEQAAVQAATRHYKSRGYEVESVETKNLGWDLEAVKGGEKLRVEVKGISKGGVYVNMTPNEFQAAQQHRQSYRLAVFRKYLDVGCAIYELRDNAQWRWIDGNDKCIAKKLTTEEKISRIMVVKAID